HSGTGSKQKMGQGHRPACLGCDPLMQIANLGSSVTSTESSRTLRPSTINLHMFLRRSPPRHIQPAKPDKSGATICRFVARIVECWVAAGAGQLAVGCGGSWRSALVHDQIPKPTCQSSRRVGFSFMRKRRLEMSKVLDEVLAANQKYVSEFGEKSKLTIPPA